MTRLSKLPLAFVAAIAVGACGHGSDTGEASGGGALAGQLRVACTTQIENFGVPAGAVDQVCECATRRAQDQLSVTDLIAGEATGLEDIVAQCIDESLGFRGGANTNEMESQ
ncbi:hypothetical protein [Qipengyuania sp. MTN3-11]|uniref:hypothetical protein n=1 Tax=Qipengyuania sp. MTN3-11 TaxID=3056557 RepID=UPI0036F1D5C6